MERLQMENVNTKEFWDDVWSRESFGKPQQKIFPQYVLDLLSHYSSIANIGCGLDNIALELDADVICVDLSEESLKYQSGYAEETYCASADKLPLKNKSVECVFASHIIEHMTDPVQAISEWSRVATDSIIILCPHDDYLNENIEHIWKITHEDILHIGMLFGTHVTFYNLGVYVEIKAEIKLRK